MSTTTIDPAIFASDDGDDDEEGVRTYRAKKLEDLIPRIRADLGPDAIILREREGLMGGLNGFFAQRFVEVQARAADSGFEEVRARTTGSASSSRIDIYDDDEEHAALQIELPPVREQPKPVPASPAAVNASPPATAANEGAAEPVVDPLLASFAAQLAEAQAAAAAPAPAEPEAAVAEPEAVTPAAVAEPGPVTPAAVAEPEAELADAPAVPKTTKTTKTTKTKPRTSKSTRARSTRRWARGSASGPGAAPAQELDGTAAGQVARELIRQGMSEELAHRLIVRAAAHSVPFASQGGLRGGVRSSLATHIPVAGHLPAEGAVIAFVGPGGAGKTRCAAALAAAYRKTSTLSVTAISLGAPDDGRMLSDLLADHDVPVTVINDDETLERHLAATRSGGLVVIDTPAVAPGNPAAVIELGARLRPLALDRVCLALPATVATRTGERLISSLAALEPTALAITHVDETDQLGIPVELAWLSGTPVAYVHEGLEVPDAISAVDPYALAARLLP